MITYSHVLIQPLKGNRYKTAVDIKYKDVTVPKGFITNGASIPRILWNFIPPNKSDVIPAIIVHDYLCSFDMYKQADKYFEEIMLHLHVVFATRKYLMAGVLTWHWLAYEDNGSPKKWLRTYLSWRTR